MRSLLTCFILSAVFLQADTAAAQQPEYDSANSVKRQNVQKRKSFAEKLIHERAVLRAKQRTARMQARKWLGVSRLRPNILHGAHSVNLNRGRAPLPLMHNDYSGAMTSALYGLYGQSYGQ